MALDPTHCVRRRGRLTLRFLHTPFVAVHDAIISDPLQRENQWKKTTCALAIFLRDQTILTKEPSDKE